MTRAKTRARGPRWLLPLALSLLGASCVPTLNRYAPRPPLTRDPDRSPFDAELKPYYSGGYWDRLDTSFFMPASRFLAAKRPGEARNANAVDEVASSSWFQGRIAEGLSAAEMALGPCQPPLLDAAGPWEIRSGKAEGRSAGFVVKAPGGRRYLLKFDTPLQWPRGMIADVVVSRLYHAAGYSVPCNSVVEFDPSILVLGPEAHVESATGKEVPMRWADVERSLSGVPRLPDGRYRAVASLYLEGKPLGPWRYVGTRRGDRNDIIPHEDRRELRGARLLAAWTSHWDHRDQNTLAMWIEASGGKGYVQHHLIDFGDSLGYFGNHPPQTIWRRTHAHWFAPGQVLADFATLGMLQRPWDRARLGPSGPVFGYFDVDQFDPERWKPIYPNPAFQLMTERDAAWMARIIARFGRADLEAIVRTARAGPELDAELVRILLGRQRKILQRYLGRLSPLSDPVIATVFDQTSLCVTDLGARVATTRRAYAARAWFGARARPLPAPRVLPGKDGQLCAVLPRAPGASASKPGYLVVELSTQPAPSRPYPARFHLYHFGENRFLLVGLERRESFDPPA